MNTQIWTYNMAVALIACGVPHGTAWRAARNQVHIGRHHYFTNHGAYALVIARQLLNDGETLERVYGSPAEDALRELEAIVEKSKTDVVRPEGG